MKKITLSKQTLRVLTSNETELVGGGATETCIPKRACVETRNYPTCGQFTLNCPPPTDTCNCPPPNTVNCPHTTLC